MINYSAHSSVFICENRKNAWVACMMFKRYVIYICGEQANQKLVDCNPGFYELYSWRNRYMVFMMFLCYLSRFILMIHTFMFLSYESLVPFVFSFLLLPEFAQESSLRDADYSSCTIASFASNSYCCSDAMLLVVFVLMANEIPQSLGWVVSTRTLSLHCKGREVVYDVS